MKASFIFVLIVHLRDVFAGGLYKKTVMMKFVYFRLAVGGESKENRLSCHFTYPPFVCEKFQLQLYTAELEVLRFRTASRLLCDFLNQRALGNVL